MNIKKQIKIEIEYIKIIWDYISISILITSYVIENSEYLLRFNEYNTLLNIEIISRLISMLFECTNVKYDAWE